MTFEEFTTNLDSIRNSGDEEEKTIIKDDDDSDDEVTDEEFVEAINDLF